LGSSLNWIKSRKRWSSPEKNGPVKIETECICIIVVSAVQFPGNENIIFAGDYCALCVQQIDVYAENGDAFYPGLLHF